MPYPNPSNEQAMREISNMGYFERNILSEVQKNALRRKANKKISAEAREATRIRRAIEDRMLARELDIALDTVVD